MRINHMSRTHATVMHAMNIWCQRVKQKDMSDSYLFILSCFKYVLLRPIDSVGHQDIYCHSAQCTVKNCLQAALSVSDLARSSEAAFVRKTFRQGI